MTQLLDSQILLPKDKANCKLMYKSKINDKKENQIIVTKILKMDENNQYGYAMTKPLSYRCVEKQVKIPTIRELNIILNNISHEEKVGHLFLVDIKFREMNEKTILFNEFIYTAV